MEMETVAAIIDMVSGAVYKSSPIEFKKLCF